MLIRTDSRKPARATQAMAQPTILTVREVAAYLRLHAVTVYRMAQSGELPAFRVGRRWRFKRDQIDQWLTDHQTSGAQAGSSQDGPASGRAEYPRSGRR